VRTLGLGIAAIAILGISALLDRESGFKVWRDLGEDLSISLARVTDLQSQNEAMRYEIEMLEAEPAAVDRAIREELDLALPGEIIVRFKDLGLRDRTGVESAERDSAIRSQRPGEMLGQETK